MIISRAKNQKCVMDAIREYNRKYPNELHRELELIRFSKFLANALLSRVEDDDCYFIDLLDDIERIDV